MSSSRTTTTGPSNSMPNTAMTATTDHTTTDPTPRIPSGIYKIYIYIGLRCGRRIIVVDQFGILDIGNNVTIMETFYTPCICEIVVYSSGITRLGRGCILSTSVIFIDITCRPGTGQGICIGCGIIATAEIGDYMCSADWQANASMPARPHTVAADECALPRRLSYVRRFPPWLFVSLEAS